MINNIHTTIIMSIFTNKTKKNITSVVMTLIMLMVFSASAMAETEFIYVLTHTLTPGEDYLIVGDNKTGDKNALSHSGTTITKNPVTVKSNDEWANANYIEAKEVDQNSVWHVGTRNGNFTFENNSHYLSTKLPSLSIIRNLIISTTLNEDAEWKWSSNEDLLYHQANSPWHLFEGSNNFTIYFLPYSVYLYKKTPVEYLNVTISKYGYTTLYFNQSLVIPYNTYNSSDNKLVDVSYASSATGSTVNMTKINKYVPKETGVVIQGKKEYTYKFPYYSNIKSGNPSAITGNKLTGSMNNTSPSDALAGHSGTSIIMTLSPHPDDMDKPSPRIGFYKFVGSTLTGKKAYLIYDTATNNGVNFLSISGMEDEAAGISNVNARIDDGAWYTLQGVRLNGAPKQRGIYIRNGKTVVVK